MYAAHLACGLAIKGLVPRAPTWAVAGGVFFPDVVWLLLALPGVETVGPDNWFDGWSHSILSIVLQSLVVGALFWRSGRNVSVAVGGAVLSHVLLDLPMHPATLQLFPNSSIRFGNLMHGLAGQPWPLGKSLGWWTEAAVAAIFLAIYAWRSRRAQIPPNIAWASVIFVSSLQLAYG